MADVITNVTNTEEKEEKKMKKFSFKKIWKKLCVILGALLGISGSFVLGVLAGSKAEQNKVASTTEPAAEPEVQPETAPAEQPSVTDAQ